ncbi:hypothetical protein MUK42_22952 [Musa troglodytarum]|uniref:Uncharacterized protein n=1 Tax=Musa troglodytarum TaxID=320322 RepID=A0A9E7JE69_9LILI|nr:hypothetical protein MUK42_22952 [Musa troglodytarum]
MKREEEEQFLRVADDSTVAKSFQSTWNVFFGLYTPDRRVSYDREKMENACYYSSSFSSLDRNLENPIVCASSSSSLWGTAKDQIPRLKSLNKGEREDVEEGKGRGNGVR